MLITAYFFLGDFYNVVSSIRLVKRLRASSTLVFYCRHTGLRPLKAFLSHGDFELRIDLTDFEGNSSYAHYYHFDMGDITENYKLKVTGYKGTAGIFLVIC